MTTMTSTTLQGQGAQGIHQFNALEKEEHPEVRNINRYLDHVGKHILGYATFVPDNKEKRDTALDFQSEAGHQRVLSPFGSAPIYFSKDWEMLSHLPNVRTSQRPLDAKRLMREFELNIKDYGDLLGLAREYKVLKGDDTASKGRLVKLIMDVELEG